MNHFWRPAWVEVDINRVIHNIHETRKQIGKSVQIIAALKGDAHGHGAVEMARQCISAGVEKIGVALVDEGVELRRNQIKIPILVFGYVSGQLAEAIDNNLILTLYLKDIAEKISLLAKKMKKIVKVHLKVDTGLNRIGLEPEEVIDFCHFVQDLGGIEIEGIYSHFSSSAKKDKTEAYLQFKIFQEVLNKLKKSGITIPVAHIANTGAIMEMPDTYLDAVRTGRLIFGVYPYPEVDKVMDLYPSLQLKCEIARIKKISAGEGVGYRAVFKTDRSTYIATLPLGYTDGLSKAFINKASVLIGGKRKKVIAMCADMCMVNLGSEEPQVKAGDEVVLIGRQGKEAVMAEELADALGVTLGEVFAHLNKRLPKVYTHQSKPYLVAMPNGDFVNID